MRYILVVCILLTGSLTLAQSPLRDAFEKVGKTIELGSCPKDVMVNVSDSVVTLCTHSKEKSEESDDVKILKNSDKTLSCSYEDGVYNIVLSEGLPDSEDSDVQISVNETGKITEISKDQLKVDGETCRELAAKFPKAARFPASADSELCFDYYPSKSLNPTRNTCKKN